MAARPMAATVSPSLRLVAFELEIARSAVRDCQALFIGASRLTRQWGQCAVLAHPFAARAAIDPSGCWHRGHGVRFNSTMTPTSPANKAASDSQFSQKLSGTKTADKTQKATPGSTSSAALFLRRLTWSLIVMETSYRVARDPGTRY